MEIKDIEYLLGQDFFSELDRHFANLMLELSGQEVPEVFLAAALVSRATGKGHVCLELSSLAGRGLETDGLQGDTIVCPELDKWRVKLVASKVVGKPGDYRPLILDERSRLYLYRYWNYENILADDLIKRAAGEIEGIDIALLKDGLSRLFEQSRGRDHTFDNECLECRSDTSRNEIDWQQVAAFVSVVKRFCVISGGPGTGKSSVIARILALILEQAGREELRIALAAPTGKAAARLQEAIKNVKGMLPVTEHIRDAIVGEASTIHRLLGTIRGSPYFRHNAENPLPVHVVVIDEASMVDLALLAKLVQAIPAQARLILLGDKDQLASVEAGAVLGDICRGRTKTFSQVFSDRLHDVTGRRIGEVGGGPTFSDHFIQDCVVQLHRSYRFGPKSGIGVLSNAVNEGDGDLALTTLKDREYGDVSWKSLPSLSNLQKELEGKVIQGFGPYLKAKDPLEAFHLFERFRLLCALREGPYSVAALNLKIEHVLSEANLINPKKRWYHGRPILITRNDYDIDLFNGDIGIILPDPESDRDLRAFFLSPEGTVRKLSPIRLPEHETVYAMTVHKSQGSEFDEALFVLPDRYAPVLTRELIYTGITRARKSLEIWASEIVFLEGVNHSTVRGSGLSDALRRD